MKNIFKTLIVLSVFSLPVLGAEYGTAGCGLGSMVFGDEPGIVQIFALTSNGFAYSQIGGITSGTSNCTDDEIALEVLQREQFAQANFETLRQEMSQGEGETIFAFASLYGCSIQAVPDFGQAVKSNYADIFQSDANYKNMTSKVGQLVSRHETLSQSCIDK